MLRTGQKCQGDSVLKVLSTLNVLELADKHPSFLTHHMGQCLGVLYTASLQDWAPVIHGRGLLIDVSLLAFPPRPV